MPFRITYLGLLLFVYWTTTLIVKDAYMVAYHQFAWSMQSMLQSSAEREIHLIFHYLQTLFMVL